MDRNSFFLSALSRRAGMVIFLPKPVNGYVETSLALGPAYKTRRPDGTKDPSHRLEALTLLATEHGIGFRIIHDLFLFGIPTNGPTDA